MGYAMLDLPPTAAALRSGTLPLADFLEDVRRRLEAHDPDIVAMLPEAQRFARLDKEAKTLAARHPAPADRPALFGIPVAVKDIIHVQGFPTKAGSSLPPAALAGEEGPVMRRLRRAGALVLGKSHTTEFASVNPAPTHNPHNLAHTPGGSSSGSAAAVAAGFSPLGIGTQTMGSVVRPAAYCGVTGFKPSQGRVPTDGIIPFSKNVDQVGFFTASVAGAQLAGAVFCDSLGAVPVPAHPGRLLVPEGPLLQAVEQDALRLFRITLQDLRAQGWDIATAPCLDDLERIRALHMAFTAAEMAAAHAAWYPRYRDLYGARTRAVIEAGQHVSPAQMGQAAASMAALRARLGDALAELACDAFVCPSATGTAPLGLSSTGDPIMNLPWTHAGLPVVSLPAGRCEGLPLGLQVIGRFGGDEALLGLCGALEKSLAASDSGPTGS